MEALILLPHPLPLDLEEVLTSLEAKQFHVSWIEEGDLDLPIGALIDQKTAHPNTAAPEAHLQDTLSQLYPEGMAFLTQNKNDRIFALCDLLRSLFPGGNFLLAAETKRNREQTLRTLIPEWREERDSLKLYHQVRALCMRSPEVDLSRCKESARVAFERAVAEASAAVAPGVRPDRKQLEQCLQGLRAAVLAIQKEQN